MSPSTKDWTLSLFSCLWGRVYQNYAWNRQEGSVYERDKFILLTTISSTFLIWSVKPQKRSNKSINARNVAQRWERTHPMFVVIKTQNAHNKHIGQRILAYVHLHVQTIRKCINAMNLGREQSYNDPWRTREYSKKMRQFVFVLLLFLAFGTNAT